MASVLCNVGLWLEHAQKVRALSAVISDPEEKQQMLVVAAGFDRIAELAKEQATINEQYHTPECPVEELALAGQLEGSVRHTNGRA